MRTKSVNRRGYELAALLLLSFSLANAQNRPVEQLKTEFEQYGLNIPTTSWTRTAFEAGVTYKDTDQIAVTTTTCPAYGWAADVYGHSVSWTTGGPSTPTKDGAIHYTVSYNNAIRNVVFNGANPVYANNQTYSDNLIGQSTTATITLHLHCLDSPPGQTDIPSAQEVKIFARLPVEKVDAPSTVEGGEQFTLEIILSSFAPASNTRVDLKWEGDGLNLVTLPCAADSTSGGVVMCHVDVRAHDVSIKLGVSTLTNTGGSKQVKVTASAKPNVQKTAIVTITKPKPK